MNNKGFAITGILYGAMIVFFMVVASFLGILSSKKKLLESATNDIKNSIELKSLEISPQTLAINNRYITPVSGKYSLSFSNCSGDIFLTKDTLIILKSATTIEINKSEILLSNLCNTSYSTGNYLLYNIGNNNSSANTFKINQIFSANN